MVLTKSGNELHTGSITHIDEPITENVYQVSDEVIKIIDNEIASSALDKKDSNRLVCSDSTAKVLYGLLLVLLIALSWTCVTQFGKSTYSANFKAPFFTTWLTTSFMVVVYPLFMIPLICKKQPWRFQTFLRETAMIFGPRGFCLQSMLMYLLKAIIPFLFIWLLTNYLYYRSLKKLEPGTVTATFSSSSCFVYILSLVVLKDKLYMFRMLSVLLSIGGIVLMGYTEGFGSSNTLGVVFVILAAFGAAVYQVLFKVVMSKASGAQVALFLSLLGLVNSLLFWPVIFILDYVQYEELEWDNLPWKVLAGASIIGVVYNYLVNFGISVTFPLFISIGSLLGIPLSAGVDAIFRGVGFDKWKIVACVLIVTGFLMMLIPKQKLEGIERCKRTTDKTDLETDNKSGS